jgi:hypothetical protein
LITISKDEAERARLRSEWKYEMDLQSKMVEAKREGRKEGRKKGEKEGRKEGRKEVALNLKNLGISVEQIAQATGLSVEDIAKLRRSGVAHSDGERSVDNDQQGRGGAGPAEERVEVRDGPCALAGSPVRPNRHPAGTLTFESERSEGTTVMMTIPKQTAP